MTESTIETIASPIEEGDAVSPRKVFWATWFGWMLDGFDSSMYAYILVGALSELLPASGIEATRANIGIYGGLLFSIFMLGWACSMVWGWAADRYGRVRIMCWTVLVYSVFTALCGSLLGRNSRGGTIVVGSASLGGSIEMVPNPVQLAELAIEKQAQTLLMPVSARRQLNDLPDELWTKISIEFYTLRPSNRASASRRTRPATEVATGLVVGQFALNAYRYEAQ